MAPGPGLRCQVRFAWLSCRVSVSRRKRGAVPAVPERPRAKATTTGAMTATVRATAMITGSLLDGRAGAGFGAGLGPWGTNGGAAAGTTHAGLGMSPEVGD